MSIWSLVGSPSRRTRTVREADLEVSEATVRPKLSGFGLPCRAGPRRNSWQPLARPARLIARDGRFPAGPSIRPPGARQGPGLHRRDGPVPGAGNRRQHGDLHPPRPGAAAAPARQGPRPAGSPHHGRQPLRQQLGRERHLLSALRRPESRESGLQRHVLPLPHRGQPELRRRNRAGQRRARLGDLLPGPGGRGGARADVHHRRRQDARRASGRGPELRLLALALRRRSRQSWAGPWSSTAAT